MPSEPTDTQLDYLQEIYRVGWKQRDPAVIAAEFKRRFRKAVDAETIQRWIDTLGCHPRRANNRQRLTWAEDRYLRVCAARHGRAKTTALLNLRFGADHTVTQVQNYVSGLNRSKGRHAPPIHFADNGQFKPGQRPSNKGQVGDETIHRYGVRNGRVRSPEIHVIVDQPNPYTGHRTHTRPKRILVWEAAHGPVPKGCNIVHVDGDWRNCELVNLACLTDAELAVLNRWYNRSRYPEDRATAILVARLKLAACNAPFDAWLAAHTPRETEA